MSGTERMRRWVHGASVEELGVAERGLRSRIASERNGMVRSSLDQQLRYVLAEQASRLASVDELAAVVQVYPEGGEHV